jgi:pyrimidine operon attenuation protein/uracil phosphoribosyltransferase
METACTPQIPPGELLLDVNAMGGAIETIAREIVARHPDPETVVMVGIPTRGIPLAMRLAATMQRLHEGLWRTGTVDVSMHRDDLGRRARPVTATELPLDLEQRTVILVDDVAYTGRTCRAAMEGILVCGRPARIEFAALIDRGLRQLPIAADYVGLRVRTVETDRVRVRLAETDGGVEGVWIDHGYADVGQTSAP